MAEEGTAVVEESPSGFVFPTGEIPTEIQSVGPEGEESPDDWGDVEGVGPEFVEEENQFTTSDDTETKPSDYFKYVPPEEGEIYPQEVLQFLEFLFEFLRHVPLMLKQH